MDTCKLKLIPDYGSSIQMVMSSDPFVPSNVDEMILNREYIYSDQPYHAELNDVSETIEDLTFFVNDMEIESERELIIMVLPKLPSILNWQTRQRWFYTQSLSQSWLSMRKITVRWNGW